MGGGLGLASNRRLLSSVTLKQVIYLYIPFNVQQPFIVIHTGYSFFHFARHHQYVQIQYYARPLGRFSLLILCCKLGLFASQQKDWKFFVGGV